MSMMSAGIARRGRRIFEWQLVLTVAAIAAAVILQGASAGYAAAAGGVISMVLMLMLRMTMQRATEIAVEAPRASMNTMYIGAVLRFVALLVMFAIALGWLKLAPTWVVGAFVLVMLTGIIASRGHDSGRPASHTDFEND